ncbi:L-threonylcarbamoyladenylate synthase [Spiroplasma culicicola]|uniref:L-threonylcarbamoyladenylate synthase n=1 Tax=Spiroplasma culicicola AES-1 TaxID=1276246 RepID=W6AI33_9MOLU|nr:Sua5/YciO/YrdC/YwlC family protein [Spiroplasma culicicola]AHI53364.1 tRNA threonylcarbamoyladenosine biosynthesis protein [Spiroplasma culicicola AES-1]
MKLLDKKEIDLAIECLLNNQIVILPTDTIYGLSSLVSQENELRINDLKGSSENKRLIILVSNLDQAQEFIDLNDQIIEALQSQEPTTVIYQKQKGTLSYAIRLIQRKDLKQIIDVTGPIFSTSVNKTGKDFLITHEQLKSFSENVSCFFTEELKNKPSIIVDFINNKKKR